MCEKKNKLSIKPVPILIENSFRLLDALYRNINEKCTVFFKTFFFDGCFEKQLSILKTLFFATISDACFYFPVHALPTPPPQYCFAVFKNISITHLWTFLF